MALLNGIQRIIICGDSMILIRAIANQNIAGGSIYMGTLSQIMALLRKFEIFSLFHIKRDLNTIADQQEKEGSCLRKSEIKIYGDLKPIPIP
jgi:hypothetical protein